MSLAKMKLVADKAMEKCDEVDGLKDGLIDDPAQVQLRSGARRAGVPGRSRYAPTV